MANTSTTALLSARNWQSMLRLLFFIIIGSVRCIAQIASTDYVTTWKTDNPGVTATNQILIPASGQYTLYYESIPAGTSGTLPASGTLTDNQTITLPAPGTYRIAIKPTGVTPFHRILFNGGGDSRKLLRVDQWGTTVWSSMQGAGSTYRFRGKTKPVN